MICRRSGSSAAELGSGGCRHSSRGSLPCRSDWALRWTDQTLQIQCSYKLAREGTPSKVTEVVEAALFEELSGAIRPAGPRQCGDRVDHDPQLLLRVAHSLERLSQFSFSPIPAPDSLSVARNGHAVQTG